MNIAHLIIAMRRCEARRMQAIEDARTRQKLVVYVRCGLHRIPISTRGPMQIIPGEEWATITFVVTQMIIQQSGATQQIQTKDGRIVLLSLAQKAFTTSQSSRNRKERKRSLKGGTSSKKAGPAGRTQCVPCGTPQSGSTGPRHPSSQESRTKIAVACSRATLQAPGSHGLQTA